MGSRNLRHLLCLVVVLAYDVVCLNLRVRCDTCQQIGHTAGEIEQRDMKMNDQKKGLTAIGNTLDDYCEREEATKNELIEMRRKVQEAEGKGKMPVSNENQLQRIIEDQDKRVKKDEFFLRFANPETLYTKFTCSLTGIFYRSRLSNHVFKPISIFRCT